MTLRYQIAINHVEFLLKVERQGTPLTVNHYFVDNLEQRYVAVMNGAFRNLETDHIYL